MRPQFTALITSAKSRGIVQPFQRLGASAKFVPFDLLTAELRLGSSSPTIAEVIIIDGSNSPAPLQQDALLSAASLALEIRNLPDHTTMQNGIRWRHIPIVIIVENREKLDRTHGDPVLRTIQVCDASRGWQHVYEEAAEAVQHFGMQLIEELRLVGWKLREEQGRYYRVSPPSKAMRSGKVSPIETTLYHGGSDRWFTSRGQRERLPLSIVHTDARTVESDFENLRRLIEMQRNEGDYQRFLNIRAYILGAPQYELLPHPVLWDADANEKRSPDYSQDRRQFISSDPAPRLVEIKVPHIPVLVNARKYKKLGAELLTGISQLRGYKEAAMDPRSAGITARAFSNNGTLGPGLLIGGILGKADKAAFEIERKQFADTAEILTYDEILEAMERRFFKQHNPDESMGSDRIMGLPSFNSIDDPYNSE